jgi:hypothetical protein
MNLFVSAYAATYNISPQTNKSQSLSIIKGLSPGDALFVKAGDYRAFGIIRLYHKRGTEQQPIRIIAENTDTEVQGFQLVDAHWVTIQGFKIIGIKALSRQWKDMPEQVVDEPGVKIDPAERWKIGRKQKVEQKYASWISILDWEDQPTAGVSIQSSQHVTVKDNDISYHTTGILFSEQSTHADIVGNHIHHTLDAISGAIGNAVSFAFSHVYDNHTQQIYREAICLRYGAHDNLVERNHLIFSGHSHIVTYQAGDTNVIQGNDMRYGGYYTETMQTPGGSGISVHSAGKDTQVIGNDISYQYDNTGRDGNGVIIDYTPSSVIVANNVIYRAMGSGITSTHSKDAYIVHNTIVESGFNGVSRLNGVGVRMSQQDDTGATIANNILVDNRVGGMFFNGNMSKQKYVDHNLIYSDSHSPVAANGRQKELIFRNLVDWQKAGYGTRSKAVDPQFANKEQQNFHVLRQSAVVGWASPEYSTVSDKDDVQRSSKPTVGAYEPSDIVAF